MKFDVTMSMPEVVEAIREYLDRKGVPPVAIEAMELSTGRDGSWSVVKDIRVRTSFECDAWAGAAVEVPVPGATSGAREPVKKRVAYPPPLDSE